MSEVTEPVQAETPPQMEPQAALEWLDTSIGEFDGAVEECVRHIAAGSLPMLEVSARLNTFMLRLMSIAEQGQQALATGEIALDGDGEVVKSDG